MMYVRVGFHEHGEFPVALTAIGYAALMKSTQYSLFTEFNCFQTAGVG